MICFVSLNENVEKAYYWSGLIAFLGASRLSFCTRVCFIEFYMERLHAYVPTNQFDFGARLNSDLNFPFSEDSSLIQSTEM